MKKPFISRLAMGCLMLMLYQIGTSQAGSILDNRAPLVNVRDLKLNNLQDLRKTLRSRRI